MRSVRARAEELREGLRGDRVGGAGLRGCPRKGDGERPRWAEEPLASMSAPCCAGQVRLGTAGALLGRYFSPSAALRSTPAACVRGGLAGQRQCLSCLRRLLPASPERRPPAGAGSAAGFLSGLASGKKGELPKLALLWPFFNRRAAPLEASLAAAPEQTGRWMSVQSEAVVGGLGFACRGQPGAAL